jgi:GWxTD domain-containing protein
MQSKTLVSCAAALVVASLAAAELPADWKDYFEGPPGYLITKKEKKAWKKTVKTAAQAEQFVELFWAKRDPDLTTPLNEFKEDFDLRVAAADEAFGYDEVRGALTERGQVLILLGRPIDRIQREPGADPTDDGRARGGVEDSGFGGGGFPTTGDEAGGVGSVDPGTGSPPPTSELSIGRERGAIEVWVYDPRSLPVKVNQKAVPVFFRETRFGMGDYPLVKDNPRNTMAMRVLSAAPEATLRNPNLSSVPRYGLIQGTQPATEQQLAWFAEDAKPWPEGAEVIASEGLYTGPRHFFWAHLHLPAGAPERVTAIGRLRNADSGEETGSFQTELEGLESEGGRGYEVSIPVAGGSWALELALAGSDGPMAITELNLDTTEVPMDATVFSPFYWGTEVLETDDAKMGDPFNVGGWHVVPRFSTTMSTDDELTYMAYVLQPKVERGSQPHFEVTLTLYEDGKRIARGTPRLAQMSQVAPDMWMFGGSIELDKFTDPGNFEIKVELSQQTDGAKQEIKIPFIIEGEETPAE